MKPRMALSQHDRATLAAALPLALAIAVFGAVYGTLNVALAGALPTLLASAVIFSGALQFTVAGLLAAGAGPLSLIAAGVILNLRHILLGAVLRPRSSTGRWRRAGLAWFLIDETVGLALAARSRAGRTLALSGALCYLAWQVGTPTAVLGGSLKALRSVAEAVFPVLFIGLATLSATRRDLAWRAVAGRVQRGSGVVRSRALHARPVLAAIAVALPGGRGER